MMTNPHVIVIGGGPAGLTCAATAAGRGRQVLLLEKMHRPALKLGITGKGRCNLTNDCDADTFLAAVNTGSRFLHSAASAFSCRDTIAMFERLGVPLKTERGGRVFPESDKAADAVRALVAHARQSGAKIVRHSPATQLLIEGGALAGVKCADGQEYRADSVVVATGGLSYPATGSTGDGYALAEQAGHEITPPRASLVPIVTRESWPADCMGLSLKNVSLTLRGQATRPLFKEQGEMLLTHFGVSGPLVLSASAHIKGEPAGHTLSIDLKPALSPEQLDARILRDFATRTNRDLANALDALLPAKLVPPIVRLSGIPPGTKVHQITKAQRARLAGLLKDLPLQVAALRPIDEAVVTAGGVGLRQVHPGSMESKLLPGLYFAGEVLDLDAYTGGFNLQIAFATGFLAGCNA